MSFKHRLINVFTILLGAYSILLILIIATSRRDITPEEIGFIFNTTFLVVGNAALSYLMGIGFKLWHKESK